MNNNSSNSSEELGNTILTLSPKKTQISPSKRWCFTLNNYTEEDISSIVPLFKNMVNLGVFNKEVGEEGTKHLQGYVEFISKVRPIGLLTKRIHWEKCRGSRMDNVFYCRKTHANGDMEELRRIRANTEFFDNRDYWAVGFKTKPTTIDRADFYPYQEEMTKLFEVKCKWDCRKIYWRYGDTNIGKTQFAKWLAVHLGACIIGGSHKHMLAQVQSAKAPIYVILLSYGDDEVSYRAIEQIKDGLFTSAFGCDNNKMEITDAPHLLVIGNEPPNVLNRNFHKGKYDVKEIDI